MNKIIIIIIILLISIPTFLFSQNGPTAICIANPVCLGEPVPFADWSTPDPTTNSPIVTWNWEYNGSTISTQQNINYMFTQCGTYDVSLTVTDADGIQDDTTINIEVFCPPTAAFLTFGTFCLGDQTDFVDVSTPGDGTPPLNSGSSWMYLFGDAVPPNAVNPSCTTVFNNAGSNPVTFIVSELQWNGVYCIDTLIQDVQIDSCFNSIENIDYNTERKIIKKINLLGKSKKTNSNNLSIIIYEDGVIEKKIIIE